MPTLTKETTLYEATKAYLKVMALEGKSKQSIKAYKSDLNQFLEFIDGTTKVGDLSGDDLEEYREYLLNKTDSKNTFNRRISGVRSFLKFLSVGQLISVPLEKFRSVPIKNKEAVYITESEFQAIISSIENRINAHREKLPDHNINTYVYIGMQLRNKVLFTTLYKTGVRISEALNLQVSDLDLDHRELLVHGKGGKKRYVPISNDLRDMIREYLQLLSTVGFTSPYLFPAMNGEDTQQSYGNAYKMFRLAVVDAGISRTLSIHSLRHGFASQALEGGMDYKTLQEILGHASPDITMNTYAHVSSQHKKESYDKIFNKRAQ